VILLSSVHENKSARKWAVLEVELARKYRKRIVGLLMFGTTAMEPEAASRVDFAMLSVGRKTDYRGAGCRFPAIPCERGLLSYQPYIFSDTFAMGAGLSLVAGHLKATGHLLSRRNRL